MNISYQNNQQYNPVASGFNVETEKERLRKGFASVKESLQQKWNQEYAGAQIFPSSIAAMHPEVVDFLLSFDLVDVYDGIAKQAGLDESGRSILPKIVWKITQSKDWNSLSSLLQEKLPNYPIANIAQSLNEKVLDKIKVLSAKPFAQRSSSFSETSAPASSSVKLALTDALEEYPKLAEQSISIDQIIIRSLSVPAKPSIKNWIADYHDKNGVGKHSPIDRGNYLFHSENGKKLTPSDRQKVGMILKSLDEQTPLNINPERQEVVFNGSQLNLAKENSANVALSENRNSNPAVSNFNKNDEEPKDIFDLKISPASQGLRRITEQQQPRIANQNLNSMDVSTKEVPFNLPTMEKESEHEFDLKKQLEKLPTQVGSAEYIQPRSDALRRSDAPENIPQAKTMEFESTKEEPRVELKNISFSPNFVAVPREKQIKNPAVIKPTFQRNPATKPLKNQNIAEQKEEIFSIPNSKPPIGTEHYDIDKARMEEKVAAITNKSFALVDSKKELIEKENNFEKAPIPTMPMHEDVIAMQSPVKNINAGKRISEISATKFNSQDLDALSDEDLFKLYQQKKAAVKPINTSVSKPKGFHIGPMTLIEEDDNPKNLVNLKEN